MSEAGVRAMQELFERCNRDNEPFLALMVARHLGVVEACRTKGVDVALADVAHRWKEPQQGPVFQLAAAALFSALPDDFRTLIAQHPELLSDAGLDALEEVVAFILEGGDPRGIEAAQTRLGLVRRCGEIGVEGAFAEFGAALEADRPQAVTWLDELAADVRQALQQTAACVDAGDLSAWDACVAAWDGLLTRSAERAGQVPTFVLFQAGMASTMRYQQSHDATDLDRAVPLWREAAGRDDLDTESADVLLPGLAELYTERFRLRGDAADGDCAIAVFEQVLDGTRASRTRWLADQAALLADRYERQGDPESLGRAIELGKAVAIRASRGSDEDKTALLRLPPGLRARLAQGVDQPESPGSSAGVAAEVQEPILLWLETESWDAAAALLARHPRLLDADVEHHLIEMAALARLSGDANAAALMDRRREFTLRCREIGSARAVAEFEAADQSLRAVLFELLRARTPRELGDTAAAHPELPAPLAMAYLQQLMQAMSAEGDQVNLGAAMKRVDILESWRVGDRFVPPTPPDRVKSATAQVAALLSNWETTDDPNLLDEAIRVGETVRAEAASASATPGDQATLANQLGVAYAERSRARASRSDMDAADSLLAEAVALAPAASQERIDALLHQSTVLGHGDAGQLRRAEDSLRALLDELSPDDTDRSLAMWNLASILDESEPYDPARQSEAVVLGQRALAITPEDSPHYVGRLTGLGVFLRHRAEHSGSLDDLRRAVGLHRRAVAAARDESAERALCLTALGHVLRDVSVREGDAGSLEEAILAYQSALDTTAAAVTVRARALTGIGNAFIERYRRRGMPEDLESAREAVTESLAIDPRPESGAIHAMTVLAGAITITQGPAGLDAAISLLRGGLRAATGDTETAAYGRVNLAGSLATRYALQGAEDDADEAEALLGAAARWTGKVGTAARAGLGRLRVERARRGKGDPDDLDRGIEDLQASLRGADQREELGVRANLARAMVARWARDGGEDDQVGAALVFRQVLAAAVDTAPTLAITCAVHWSSWALEREAWAEAIDATGRGLTALDSVVRTQLRRDAKADWIGVAQGLASGAALARHESGDDIGGVLALEQGRALILTEALDRNRLDLEALTTAGHGDIAERYAAAAERWMALTRADQGELTRVDLPGRIAHARSDLERAVAEVRTVPGHQGFGAAPTASDLRVATAHECLVYVSACTPAGVAFVVRSEDDLQSLSLPALTLDALREHASEWAAAYLHRLTDRQAWWRAVDRTTQWLWEVVMEPVHAQLAEGQAIALVANGLLGVLPLHAAWRRVDDLPRYVVDDRAVRYVPNARTFVEARRRAGAGGRTGAGGPGGAGGLLAVEDPEPTRHVRLPNAEFEVTAASRYVSPGPVRRLVGATATLGQVLQVAPSARVLHFCCHGEADPDTPLMSGLDLADDSRLTAQIVLNSKLSARLAVLSACESGLVGSQLPDELVGMPAAFLEAGAAGVVASLWSVPELATAVILEDFYRRWGSGSGQDGAAALCAAQSWARQAGYEELHERHPGIADFDPARIPEVARSLWQSTAPFRRPCDWAALTYVGA
ncbi:MAG: CHAT domain-containing protein [Dermatophilaceae bacterium]